MGKSLQRATGKFVDEETNSMGDSFNVGTPLIQTTSLFGQVAVGTTAVELKLTLATRRSLTIVSPAAIYIGASGVTTTTGCLVPANVPITLNFDVDVYVHVFAVGAAATQVSVIEA